MTTVFLGIIAALAWGIHDICVRYVSHNTGIFPSFLTVLLTGTVLFTPIAVFAGDWDRLTSTSTVLAVASGLVFGVAGLAHFKAFSIGPVKLVAPIIGAYPVLSVAWAALNGSPIDISHWFAVLLVVAGVAVVAALSDSEESGNSRLPIIGWAVAASLGWAGSFGLGQAAASEGAGIAVIFLTHMAALAIVFLLALATRTQYRARLPQVPLLATMGALDTLALGSVLVAGALPRPEFAAVAASTFGLITVLLAWLFLRERMSWPQWSGVLAVFLAIGYLGV